MQKLGFVGAAAVVASIGLASGPTHHAGQLNKAQKSAVKRGLDANHEAFVQNAGQWKGPAKYRAQTAGLDYWLTKDSVTFDYHRAAKHNGKLQRMGQVIKMSFAGSSGSSSITGGREKVQTAKYMTGTGGAMVSPHAFGEVTSHGVYPGIDFRSYYDKEDLRYDFIVRPNANPSEVQLQFKGASKITVEGNDVKLGTQLGTFAHGKLFAYQTVGGQKVQVPAQFVSNGGTVGFKVGRYDHTKPLVIDPVVYGTYYGGDNGWDAVTNVVSDGNGNVFMTGWTQATTFPVTTGPYFTSLKGFQNAFVIRLQGDAYDIDYAAFFGGSNTDYGQYISVDQFNNVWIAGVTTSPDFPGLAGQKLHTSPTQPNVFVMRWQASQTLILDPVTNQAVKVIGYDGGGGGATEFINGFAIVPDPNPLAGDPVILVMDGKSDHPTPEINASFGARGGPGFLLRYSFSGSVFTNVVGASQYVGDGLAVDMGGLAVDDQGDMYVCGDVGDQTNNYQTSSVSTSSFVTTTGPTTSGQLLQKQDLFARKYGPTGTLTFSCVIGGSSNEFIGGTDVDQAGNLYTSGNCIAVDSLGDVFITGNCNSVDYPRSRGAFGETFDAWQNVVVTKISPDATQILYSTNLKVIGLGEPTTGGASQSSVVPSGIAIDQSGQAYITGNIDVAAMDFPSPPGSPEDPTKYVQGGIHTQADGSDLPLSTAYTSPTPGDLPTGDDWLNVLDPTGTVMVYGTYLGGFLDDKCYGPYVDPFGDVWIFGWTDSIRSFTDPVSGNPVTDTGSLPAGLITRLAFKAVGDAGQYAPFTGILSNGLWGIIGNPQSGPFFNDLFEAKDGWLAKMSIGRPIVSQIDLTPPTIPGGDGASSSCNIILSSAAPVQGATITVDLLTSNHQSSGAASFNPTTGGAAPVTTTTITIPGGATQTTPIPIFSEEVTVPTQVLVRAFYQGNFLIAPLQVVPWLTNFSVTPSSTIGGNNVTGTILLAAQAPAGGITVQIQSSSALLSPPASVNIAAGQQTATFPVTSAGVDLKSFPVLTASLFNFGIAQSVELDPASIVSVVLNPVRVSGLTSIAGTAVLNGLPGPNFPTTTVLIQTNPAGYSVNPGTLTFNSSGTATFTINTPYENSTQVRVCEVDRPAKAGTDYVAQSSLSNFTVDPTPLLSFTLDKATANPGDTVNGTLVLSNTADSNGTIVNVSANSNVVSFVSGSNVTSTQVIVPSGSTGATFPIFVGASVVTAPTTVTITATRGPVTIQRSFLVNPSTLQLTLSTNSVLGGNPVTGTLTISDPAPAAGLPVTVTFNPTGLASATSPVMIPPFATTVDFPITTVSTATTTNVLITATAGTISSQQTLTVRAPSVTGITFTPAAVRSLHVGTTQCRITLDGPAAVGGMMVTLNSSNPLVASVPASIMIPAGKSFYTFSVVVKRVSRALTTTVTAQDTNGNQVSATLTALRS